MSAVEQTILGTALRSPELATEVVTRLQADDFFEPRHQLIFQAIHALIETGKPLDPVSVITQLGDDTNRVGGAPYLFELLQSATAAAALPHHVETLRGQATTRRLTVAGERIRQLADTLPPQDALNEAQALLDGLTGVDEGTSAERVGDGLESTLEHILAVQEGRAPRGLMTDFHDLDALTNGFQGGQMIIVAARPGVGKSTLAVDFMRNMSIRHNVPTLLFSLEMKKAEFDQRILSAETSINNMKFKRKGGLSRDDWGKIREVKPSIENAPLFIDDNPSNTVMDVWAKTKAAVKKHGIKMVVVDYLQLLTSGVREESRQQEVSNFSRRLKLLAKECDIPVIAISQFNREVEKRGDDARPKPSDLRESGSLEQDADLILLIHRPESQNKDHERAGEADIIVAKNRGGETGTVTVASQMHYSRFSNLRRM